MISRSLSLFSTPFIVLLSIPLTILALFTTSLAFGTLLLRVSIVYLELVLALFQSFITPRPPVSKALPSQPAPLHGPVRHHARRRTSSSGSTTSLRLETPLSHTPFPHNAGGGRLHKNPSLASLLGTTTPRDYESVGGWRLTSANSDEEALWTGINSRLELPALTVPSPNTLTRTAERYHHRSLTGGSRRGSGPPGTTTGSPELKPRSPGGKRGKGSGTVSPEGYFTGLQGQGLGMTIVGGDQRGSADGSRVHSRRSSVSLVKVRGE
ncbi:hypothetical protein CAC42_4932 [Sphaceloma murrayae]|uniref:Uncharacterized protein n=1 Tax=Sphaceloma murrayae TaxID=2082308 RepID=A0A2K1QPE0_9PEZI|nr:hypothetical protein CAC42_4932 [Sphaceloma murrayae]